MTGDFSELLVRFGVPDSHRSIEVAGCDDTVVLADRDAEYRPLRFYWCPDLGACCDIPDNDAAISSCRDKTLAIGAEGNCMATLSCVWGTVHQRRAFSACDIPQKNRSVAARHSQQIGVLGVERNAVRGLRLRQGVWLRLRVCVGQAR